MNAVIEISVPVSVGELLDKVTILRIKEMKILEEGKLANVRKELAALEGVCRKHGIDSRQELVGKLMNVNLKLWEIEDAIREKERAKRFDEEFIELARAVYVTNDQRFVLKHEINRALGSVYQEEKSYKPY